MKFLSALAVVSLLIAPPAASAQQISPIPNPGGNTIIVDTATATNDVSFNNLGTIDIHGQGTLTNRAAMENNNNGAVYLQGLFNNSGTFTHDGYLFEIAKQGYLTNHASAEFDNGVTFSNYGTLSNDGLVSNQFNSNLSQAFTNQASGLFENSSGSTFVNRDARLDNLGQLSGAAGSTFENSGLWNNHQGGVVTVGGTFANQEDGQFSNAGHFTNAGEMTNAKKNAKVTNTATGTFENSSGATFSNQDWVSNQGVINNDGTINQASLFDSKGTVNNGGTFNNQAGSFLSGAGQWNNEGTFHNQAGGEFQVAADGHFQNGGTVQNQGSFIHQGSWLNLSTGVLTNQGDFTNGSHMTNQAGGQITNQGTFVNSETSSIVNDGEFVNEKTLTNNGTIDTTNGTLVNHGAINGSGKIIGNHTDYGVTRPGHSAGVMTIDGDYFKVAGSKEIELGGLFDGGGDNAIAEFDRIDVTGNVELAGLLHVSLIDGFEKRINRGQVFEFLRVGGTLSGQYEGLGEGALVGNFGGQDLFITYGGMGDGRA